METQEAAIPLHCGHTPWVEMREEIHGAQLAHRGKPSLGPINRWCDFCSTSRRARMGKLRQREEGTQAFWGINSINAFPLLVRTHEDIAVPARSSACLLASSALTLRLSPGTSTLIATLLVGGRHADWTVLLRLRCRKPVVRRRWLRAVVSGTRLRDPRPSLHQKAARAVRGEPQVWARPQLRVVVAKALQQGAGLISNSKAKPTTQVNK